MANKFWRVYLSGEIHSDWREKIIKGAEATNLPIHFSGPITDHHASDDCGENILGEESRPFWRDHKGAGINAIRTRSLIADADIVIVRFGDKYRQWNAAFEAGYAAALGKSIITIHPADLTHALKEVDRTAMAVTENPDQVVKILNYIVYGIATRDFAKPEKKVEKEPEKKPEKKVEKEEKKAEEKVESNLNDRIDDPVTSKIKYI
jgi:YtoQ family protein